MSWSSKWLHSMHFASEHASRVTKKLLTSADDVCQFTNHEQTMKLPTAVYGALLYSAGEPMARVPQVAREMILRGTHRTLEIKDLFKFEYYEIIEIAISHFIIILLWKYFAQDSLGIGR